MRLTILATTVFLCFTACQHVEPAKKTIRTPAPVHTHPPVHTHEESLPVHPGGKTIASLPARWTDANPEALKKDIIIYVPGSGNQTCDGIQLGNGFSTYAAPVATGKFWQETLALAGYDVLAYDKRVGTTGPAALADDLDAACDAVRARFRGRREIILWSSEQGTQVILSSRCLHQAKAIVLLSPIPDSLDRVWISGLKEAGLRDRALSLSATFESIRKGQFESDAKVMGATLTFWRNWMKTADATANLLDSLKIPALFVVGQNDVWLGSYGRGVIKRIASNKANRKMIVIESGDRALLRKDALSPSGAETIVLALESLGKVNGR